MFDKAGKLLFFYTFIFSIIIAVSSVVSNANTGNIILQIIFLPVLVYFMYGIVGQLILSNKQKRKPSFTNLYPNIKNHPSVIAIYSILFALLLGLSTYKLFNIELPDFKSAFGVKQDAPKTLENALSPQTIPDSIKIISKDRPKADESTASAKIKPTPTAAYHIIIKSDIISIREKPEAGSKIIRYAEKGYIYPWIKTNPDGWVEIELEEGKHGWVDFHFVDKKLKEDE